MNRPRLPANIARKVESLRRLEQKLARSAPIGVTALDPLAKHLDITKVPLHGDFDPGADAEFCLVLASFKVVLLCASTSRYASDTSFVLKLASFAPGIAQWAEFIISQCLDVEPDAALLDPHALDICLSTLVVMVSIDELREIISKTTTLLQSISHYWLDENGRAADSELDALANILDYLLKTEDPFSTPVEALIRAAGWNYRLVARAVMRGARLPDNGGDATRSSMQKHLSIMMYLSLSVDSKILPALLAAGAVPSCLKCVAQLNTLPDSNISAVNRGRFHAIVTCYLFITEASRRCAAPVHLAIRAVQGDIIDLIASSANLTPSNAYSVHHYCDALANALAVITPYMCFYRVIHAVQKRVRVHILPRRVGMTAMNGAWKSLLELVDIRCLVRKEFKEDYIKVCHSPECDTPQNTFKYPLKVCVDCGVPRYCSKSCQRRHWPSHKEICLDYQRDYFEHSGPALPIQERVFIFRLSEQEILGRTNDIRAIWAEKYPTMPITGLHLRIDWRIHPPELDVLNSADLNYAGEAPRVVPPGDPLNFLIIMWIPWDRKGTTWGHYMDTPKELTAS